MPEKRHNVSTACTLLAGLIIAASACTKTDLQYGSQLVGDQYTNIVMTDTFSTALSTIYLDSFVTSASGSALIGSYYDDAFGQVTASTYLRFSPPSFSDKSVVYDSIELVLESNKNWYGDSTQPLQFQVYQLAQSISKTNSTSWYNHDSLSYASTPIGERTLIVYPSVTDTLSIRLSDALGKQLLSLLQNGSDEVSSASNFLNFFKGICIIPASSKAGILGFKDSMQMRLHYKEISGAVAINKTADFILYDNASQFNHISVDRSSTALEKLGSAVKALPSTSTGNAGFLQSATGTLVKINVPYVRNILQSTNYLKLERAILTVKPVAGTYEGYYSLPDSLRLTTTNKNNEIGTDITYTDGSVEYGELVHDNLYGENTAYTYDITTYLTEQVAIAEGNENGLLLRPTNEDLATKFNRLVVGDAQHSTNRIQLKIYYLTVQ